MSDVSQIDGSAVRLRREAQGWALNDLAARACLSVKQIKQIEEGGLSSFYSESVKLTAARKVAGLLQLSEAQLFGQVTAPPPQAEEESFLFAANQATSVSQTPVAPVGAASYHPEPELSGVHLIRSEPLHFLAQPPEPESGDLATATQALQPPTIASDATDDRLPPVASPPASPAQEAADAPSENNYFLKILVLFLVAIAVAALLRPKSAENSAPGSENNTGQNMSAPSVANPSESGNSTAIPVTGPSAEVDPNAKPASAADQAVTPAATPSTAPAAGVTPTTSSTTTSPTPAATTEQR